MKEAATKGESDRRIERRNECMQTDRLREKKYKNSKTEKESLTDKM